MGFQRQHQLSLINAFMKLQLDFSRPLIPEMEIEETGFDIFKLFKAG